LADDDFSAAVQRFLDEEQVHIGNYLREASEMLPFKKADGV
jgi:predicted N-acyltransferase